MGVALCCVTLWLLYRLALVVLFKTGPAALGVVVSLGWWFLGLGWKEKVVWAVLLGSVWSWLEKRWERKLAERERNGQTTRLHKEFKLKLSFGNDADQAGEQEMGGELRS